MYFLSTGSGETRWTFETGDAVKSCPAVDPLTGLVVVGSHDGNVYALNPQVRVFLCFDVATHRSVYHLHKSGLILVVFFHQRSENRALRCVIFVLLHLFKQVSE